MQVEFEFGTDLDDAVNKLQTAINRIEHAAAGRGRAAGVRRQHRRHPGRGAGRRPAAATSRPSRERLHRPSCPSSRASRGSARSSVTGARDEQVVITPDPAKLAAAGVDPTAHRHRAAGQRRGRPGRRASPRATSALTVQVGTPLTTVDDLREHLPHAGQRRRGPVRLGDVATVEQQLAAPTSYHPDQRPASLGIAVTATPDGNAGRGSPTRSGTGSTSWPPRSAATPSSPSSSTRRRSSRGRSRA